MIETEKEFVFCIACKYMDSCSIVSFGCFEGTDIDEDLKRNKVV